MLSSRYIHLHEALGLGPLWLKRGARVQGKSTVEDTARPATPATPAPPTTTPGKNTVQAMIVRLAAEKKAKTAPEPPPVPVTSDTSTHIAVRTIYAVTGDTLWLTLRPSLNAAAHEIDTGEFGRLLKQLIRSSGNPPAQWHSLPDNSNDLNTSCLQLLAEHPIRRLVFLGEDIDPALNISTHAPDHVRTLALSHPARLLRQTALKKSTWRALAAFFFGEEA